MKWQFSQHSDDEGLRLIVAFLQITDPGIRAALIEAAESAATPPPLPADDRMLMQDNWPA